MTKPKGLLMLDLDGTVRESIKGGFINEPKDQRIISGAQAAIAQYAADGWVMVGITNQRGCDPNNPEAINPATGKPWKTFGQVLAIQRQTMRLIPQLRRVYLCPDGGDTCWIISKWLQYCPWRINSSKSGRRYRKPDPGMLMEALDWFYREYYPDLTDSLLTGLDMEYALSENIFSVLYVGDRQEDCDAVENLKLSDVNFFWASEFHNSVATKV